MKRTMIFISSVLVMIMVCFTTFAATSDVVKEIQQLLNEQGYDCGNPDGIIGAKTVNAITQYQQEHGLQIIGEADEKFLETLKTQNTESSQEELLSSSKKTEESLLSSSGKTEEQLKDEIAALQVELDELLERKRKSTSANETSDTTINDADPEATTWELKAGNYYAGVDIPAGKFDATALSGTGNLSSSNLWSGGVNEMFGIDDSGWYVDTYKGIKLPEGECLYISGNLTVKLEYKSIDLGAAGRKYNEADSFELSSGNYTSGEDFSPGIYNIIAVSGTGNLSSSNLYDGGVNEMFGVDDGTGWYINQVSNVLLPEGVDLEVAGMTVKLIPAIE